MHLLTSGAKVARAARVASARWLQRWTAAADEAPAAPACGARGAMILTRRFGEDVRGPTDAQLSDAVRELLDAGADYGTAALLSEGDGGATFVVELTSTGEARFEQWADRSFARELEPRREGSVRDSAEALRLWGLLAAGDLAALRAWRWGSP